jgi:hypothetical protein
MLLDTRQYGLQAHGNTKCQFYNMDSKHTATQKAHLGQ